MNDFIDLNPRVEKRRLSSYHPDGSLMFPGTQLFIWLRPPHFPWVLAGFGPLEAGEATID